VIPLRDDNPTRRLPWITLALIAANVGAFIYSLGLDQASLAAFWTRWAVVPARLLADPLAPAQALTVFTAMFMHAGWLHIIGNMLYLWIFGNNVEDALGPVRFLLFYLLGGLAAGLSHTLLNPASKAPMIGASGAVAAVLAAYAYLFPRARVHTLVFLIVYIRVIPVPAILVLGLWFVLQLVNAGAGGGVAWFAHIGGFLAGLLLILLLARKKPALPADTPGVN